MKTLYPYFSQNPLDRLDQTRRDEKEVLSLLDKKSSLFLLFDGSEIIVNEQKQQCFFDNSVLLQYGIEKSEVVLLGSFEG